MRQFSTFNTIQVCRLTIQELSPGSVVSSYVTIFIVVG